MREIINEKVNQLEGHVNNLNTLKKELEGESAMVLNNTFPKDKEEYTKTTVNQMLKDYEEERKRIDDLEKKLDEIKEIMEEIIMNTNKIIEKAKESYDRYFKDAPVLPDNHEQDVVCNTEEIEKIIEKKKAQLDGHVENLNALKKEIEVIATDKLNKTFTEDAAEYAKKAVNQMLADYEEENNRIADLKKKLATLKK